jgi:aspartate/tyrosine/aromatic aminotransferase
MENRRMFELLPQAPPDAILGLAEAFRQDPSPRKINLSVGVYQDEQGRTPILECVKRAEERLLAREVHKSYLPIEGHAGFAGHVQKLLLGADHALLREGRVVTAQTPGGTAALRVAADLLKRHFPQARVWMSVPTWANHPAIFKAAGLEVATYPYLDRAGRGLDVAGMLEGLSQAAPGDVVLLHACCHNPTGVDPTAEQWAQIAEVVQQRGLVPLVDFAYQGFGQGLEEDAAGLRVLAGALPELLVASSFSKNFGLYGERVGALTVVAPDREAARRTLSQVRVAIRTNYSNPPLHGAAIVACILDDADLSGLWQQELAAMRQRIARMRALFVATMRRKAPQHDFSFLQQQRGMFSFSGLTNLQVDELRTRHSVYVVGNGGRINVAGMTPANMEALCDAIAAVL